jgi:hypothetical protein
VPLKKPVRDLSKASLNLKGPFGVTNLKVCSQKIVPIFLFFLFGPEKTSVFFLPPVGNLPDFGKALKGPGKLKFSLGNQKKKKSIASVRMQFLKYFLSFPCGSQSSTKWKVNIAKSKYFEYLPLACGDLQYNILLPFGVGQGSIEFAR